MQALKSRLITTRMTKLHTIMVVAAIMLMMTAVSFAQTAEPPVIEIPIDDSISYLNTWIALFAPIMLFIGMIPVALGLLRYITRLFSSAFGGISR